MCAAVDILLTASCTTVLRGWTRPLSCVHAHKASSFVSKRRGQKIVYGRMLTDVEHAGIGDEKALAAAGGE